MRTPLATPTSHIFPVSSPFAPKGNVIPGTCTCRLPSEVPRITLPTRGNLPCRPAERPQLIRPNSYLWLRLCLTHVRNMFCNCCAELVTRITSSAYSRLIIFLLQIFSPLRLSQCLGQVIYMDINHDEVK